MPTANAALDHPLHTEAKTHADAVWAHIHQLIEADNGWLRFDKYMQAALYAPGLGYYVAGKRKFGAEGDYVTAPEIGELFGRCMARQCVEVLQETGGDLLELGAGSGVLACTVLSELKRMDVLPDRYLILEVSPDLKVLQQSQLREQLGGLADRVMWLDQLPEAGFKGVMLANEVLDAIPARRFCANHLGEVNELGVKVDNGQLALATQPADETLSDAVQARKKGLGWPATYCSELNLQAESWVGSLAERLEQGALLLFDYGFPRHELYHPDRAEGTLMCHYRHQAHSDALANPGLQDVTTHVDFTAIAEVGQDAELNLAGFTHQASFLMNLGLLEMISPDSDIEGQLRLSQEIKKLTLPHEMGELFKAIAFTRNINATLSGFSRNDQSHRLWTTFKSSS